MRRLGGWVGGQDERTEEGYGERRERRDDSECYVSHPLLPSLLTYHNTPSLWPELHWTFGTDKWPGEPEIELL